MEKLADVCLEKLPVWKIILAITSDPDYEMSRIIVLEDYPDYEQYTVLHGYHCSCYDFDDTEWEAIAYTDKELKKVAAGWQSTGDDIEREAAPFLLRCLAWA